MFGKTRKIDHDFFGQMTFIGGKISAPSDYFECRRHFKPSNNVIEMGIDGNISGPTEKQIIFFESVETNYSNITNSIIPLIENEFRNWKEDFRISDFNKEFKPVYIRLPPMRVRTNYLGNCFRIKP